MMKNEIRIGIKTLPGYEWNRISGFAKAVSGTETDYHSHHPEAGAALLARAKAGMNRIEWLSAQIPAGTSSPEFVFLCALAGSKGGGHRFTLYAEEEALLSFNTPCEGEEPFVDIVSSAGAKLRFDKRFTDAFGDHFGYLYLSLPQGIAIPAEGLRFSIRAEEAHSEDWFILHQYAFSPLPRVCWEPVLLRRGEHSPQALKITYDNIFGPCELSIETELESLTPDLSDQELLIKRVAVPAQTQTYQMLINAGMDGKALAPQSISVLPTIPRRVHILPFSHNDIGYTDLQDKVLQRQYENLTAALDMKDATADYPHQAQGRWNLEVIWALESWWESASAEQKQRLLIGVKSGHIGLNALHNNLLSGLCHRKELDRHLDFSREFTAQTGILIDTAAVTDIPGFVWALVEAMYAAGVRFFALAPNSGDRVGHIYDLADKPFYWAAPKGDAKVLTWIFGAGYSMFHREKLGDTGLKRALRYLGELQDKEYPYPLIPLSYTIGGDNGTPDAELPDFVRDWNAEHASPEFIISTHAAFFHEFDAGYGADLPVLKGDMTPYWEDGAASTALETKLNRNAADRLQLVENLYRAFLPESYPKAALKQAWRKVILFDEHTWGAWNSVSEPDSDFVTGQWKFKRQLALDADRLSQDLLAGFLAKDALHKPADGFYCYNALEHASAGMAILPKGCLHEGQALCDERGKASPMQVLHDGSLGLWLESEQGLERRFIRPADALKTGIETQESIFRGFIENDWIRLRIDPDNCSIGSIYHKERELELLAPGENLLRYLYMQGSDRDHLLSVHDGEIVRFVTGEICQELLLKGQAPGCKSYQALIRVFNTVPRIDLEIRLDKLAVREKESVHLAFPFVWEGARLRYDGAGMLVDPWQDFIPGSCRNFFCPEGLVDVASPSFGLAIALKDNPLIEIGGITAELPWLRSIEHSTRFFAYLMNNYWHTNYKADQSGEVSFRFSLFFHQGKDVLQYSRAAGKQPITGLVNDDR